MNENSPIDKPRQEEGLEKVETKPALSAREWLTIKGNEYADRAEDSSTTEEAAKHYGRMGEIFDKVRDLLRTNPILDAKLQETIELDIVYDIADSLDENMDKITTLQIAIYLHSLPTEKGK